MNRGHEKLAEATRRPLLEDEWERIARAAQLPEPVLAERAKAGATEYHRETKRRKTAGTDTGGTE